MSKLINRVLFCTVIVFFLPPSAKAQFISLADYENKAQGYAILSAQYSKLAYIHAKKMSLSDTAKTHADTGRISSLIALEFADSAIYYSNKLVSKKAIVLMKKSMQYQQKAMTFFKNYLSTHTVNNNELVFSLSHAINDAYHASLMFEGLISQELNPQRQITRIETDEHSFMTIKELYNKRLTDVNSEIKELQKQELQKKGKELDIVKQTIEELKKEQKTLTEKIKTSSNKLLNIQNELSEKMLQIVAADIFTTKKTGFYSDKVPIPINPEMPQGLVYRIQIGFFRNELPEKHFDGIFPLATEKIDNVYFRYIAGSFPDYSSAKEALEQIHSKGYSDAFIIAYLNGKKITISEALSK